MYSIFMFREQECGLDVTLARATGYAVQVLSHYTGSKDLEISGNNYSQHYSQESRESQENLNPVYGGCMILMSQIISVSYQCSVQTIYD